MIKSKKLLQFYPIGTNNQQVVTFPDNTKSIYFFNSVIVTKIRKKLKRNQCAKFFKYF